MLNKLPASVQLFFKETEAMKIRFTTFCPACGNHDVAPDKLKGIESNRKLSLASDIVTTKNLLAQFNPKKEQASILMMDARLLKLEQELVELGQTHIWFNEEFVALRS